MDSLCHPCITTTHLSYSFLFLKLPPPPCAVLLVTDPNIYIHSIIYPSPGFLLLKPYTKIPSFCSRIPPTSNRSCDPWISCFFAKWKWRIWGGIQTIGSKYSYLYRLNWLNYDNYTENHDESSHFWRFYTRQSGESMWKLGALVTEQLGNCLEQANRHNLVTWMGICPLLAVFHAQAAWGQLPIDETSPEGLHVVTSQVPIWGMSVGGGLFWFVHPLLIKYGCSWRISVLIGTTHTHIYISRQLSTATFDYRDYRRVSSRKMMRPKLLHHLLFGGNIMFLEMASISPFQGLLTRT